MTEHKLIELAKEYESQNKIFPKFYINMTGGGSLFLADIMSKPGASKVIGDVKIPYGVDMFDVLCSDNPKYGCLKVNKKNCYNAAVILACNAMENALKVKQFDPEGIYIGLTCSLQNKEDPNQQRTGRDNVAYICCIYGCRLYMNMFVLDSNETRKEQEHILSYCITEFIYKILTNTIDVHLDTHDAPYDYVVELAWESDNTFYKDWSTFFNQLYKPEFALYSGSFNPMHEAHKHIAGMRKSEQGIYQAKGLVLEVPFKSFGKPENNKMNYWATGDVPLVRTNVTKVIDKLELFDALNFWKNCEWEPYTLTCGCSGRMKLYKLGSDTLTRMSVEDCEKIKNDFPFWKIEVWMRQKELTPEIVERLNALGRYELKHMPDDLVGISSTRIRQQQEEKETEIKLCDEYKAKQKKGE